MSMFDYYADKYVMEKRRHTALRTKTRRLVELLTFEEDTSADEIESLLRELRLILHVTV